jgi:hypothetical protein
VIAVVTGTPSSKQSRLCACGCGISFVPSRYNQRYFNRKHCRRAKWRRYVKRHCIHKEYRGKVVCLKCGCKGEQFDRVRDKGVVIATIVQHRKRVYSRLKYKQFRKQGLSSQEAKRRDPRISKTIRTCFI